MPENELEVKFSIANRLVTIKTILPDEKPLYLERFEGTETLSAPFEFKLKLLSTDLELDLKALLGTAATIKLAMPEDGKFEYFNGIFSSIRQKSQSYDDLVEFEATLVPSLWLLSLETDSRIFQKKSVPEIVEEVLKERVPNRDMPSDLRSKCPKRDYCVQYRETNLNFICRLLEEEGIYFYFDHTEKKHTMVFRERSQSAVACPQQEEADYVITRDGQGGEKDGIFKFERLEQLLTTSLTLRDYNFETPKLNLEVMCAGPDKPHKSYDYPGKYGNRTDGDRYARIRLEASECNEVVFEGTSGIRAFRPGYKFKLKEHYRKDLNDKEYVLTSITHQAMDTTFRTTGNKGHHYENTFLTIPQTVPYRPPQTAVKPIVQGSQTAVVVGPSGDEIYVDNYGRVKVQFFWDRVGKKDENSSCWMRVAQIWAGKNWGWMTIPRIGQEVIVDFLEGNPDQPIITGRVYNADQMPPYVLPANQTQSGFKSRSSKGGGTDNFNEIKFEDLKGSELFSMQAEKDMLTLVKHDDTQTIKNDRTITVDGKHTETVKLDTSITITEGNHSLKVSTGNNSLEVSKGNDTTKISMGNQSTTISMGNKTTKISLGKSEEEAMQSIELKVGASSIKIDQMGVTIKGMMITIEGSAITQVKGNAMLIAKGGITMIN